MEMVFPSSPVQDASWSCLHQGQSTTWTEEENKMFESAIAMFDEKNPNRWYMLAEMIPGKTVSDVITQYRELVADVSDIEAGLVPIPGYLASPFSLELEDQDRIDAYRKKARTCDHERRKGVPWTEEEHRRFLLGLQKYGKGDWRNISRNFVISKTSTQVASHAQKYYLRQLSGAKDKRRPSIHDIHLDDISQVDYCEHPPSCKSNDHIVLQKPADTSKIVMDWTQSNDRDSMMYNSARGHSLVAYPHRLAMKSGYLLNVRDYGKNLSIHSPNCMAESAQNYRKFGRLD